MGNSDHGTTYMYTESVTRMCPGRAGGEQRAPRGRSHSRRDDGRGARVATAALCPGLSIWCVC